MRASVCVSVISQPFVAVTLARGGGDTKEGHYHPLAGVAATQKGVVPPLSLEDLLKLFIPTTPLEKKLEIVCVNVSASVRIRSQVYVFVFVYVFVSLIYIFIFLS